MKDVAPQSLIVLAGGGTGGHIFPAIAIAQALVRQSGCAVRFIGAKGRMEMEKVPAAGFMIEGIRIAGLQRKADPRNVLLPFLVIGSVFRSFQLLVRWKPKAVIGVGGYVSAPVLVAAWLLGIQVYIQEQNAYAGLTNKLLARFAKRIFVSFEGLERVFPKSKVQVVGNPIRSELEQKGISSSEAKAHFGLNPDIPCVLVIGGSLGARAINDAVSGMLDHLIQSGIQLLWQTGKHGYDAGLKSVAGRSGIVVQAFFYQMPEAYAAADLVVSRAGALAVSELCAQGKPAILIPSPYVAEQHQHINARVMVDAGAAKMLDEADCYTMLLPTIMELLQNDTLLRQMSKSAHTLARPQAADRIAALILADLSTHTGNG